MKQSMEQLSRDIDPKCENSNNYPQNNMSEIEKVLSAIEYSGRQNTFAFSACQFNLFNYYALQNVNVDFHFI